MKPFHIAVLILCAVLFIVPLSSGSEDPLSVVTTIPDLADMAQAVGGDRVKVKSITKGREDMHMIPMKPSYLLILNRADVLIEMGLDAEHAWLPELLYNCRNDAIQPGKPGFINCSAGIPVLERYVDPSRAEGEIHPDGKPHHNLDPENGLIMVRTICTGLCRVRPQDAPVFKANLKAYTDRLEARIRAWKKLAEPLRGVKVVTYHRSWSYFTKRFGLEVIGEVEPKPGIAPTAGHLARLIRSMKDQDARLVIKETYYSDKYPKLIQEKTGVPFLSLPNMSGGTEATATYIDLIDHNLKALLKALGEPVSPDPRPAQEEEGENRDG
jgi:ABC-type Zn uptake system ZnuABC Zn-binding protein ZnuA